MTTITEQIRQKLKTVDEWIIVAQANRLNKVSTWVAQDALSAARRILRELDGGDENRTDRT